MSEYNLGEVKDRWGRRYEVIWDDYSGKVWCKLVGGNHELIGKADSAREAMLKADAWAGLQEN